MQSFRRFWIAGALAGLAAASAGCKSDTEGSLLNEVLNTSQTATPTAAAIDTFDRANADRRRRGLAALAASPFGHVDTYVRLYRNHLTDPDPTVRAAAAKALGMHGDGNDVHLLIPYLKDEDSYVRWQAAEALQRLHHPAAADPLAVVATSDEDDDVRQAAATALGQYARPGVFDALVKALGDRNYTVASAARVSLETLTGHDAGLDYAAWMQFADEHQEDLFARGKPYTFEPYPGHPSWVQRLNPISSSKIESAEPQRPRGVEG